MGLTLVVLCGSWIVRSGVIAIANVRGRHDQHRHSGDWGKLAAVLAIGAALVA